MTKLKGLDNFKRAMAFVLTLIIITTSVPMNVLATETELGEHNHDHELFLASSTDDVFNITEELVIEHADLVTDEEGLVKIEDQDIIVFEEESTEGAIEDTSSESAITTTDEAIDTATESALLAEIKADMDAILEEFGLEIGMTEDEIVQAIAMYQGSQNPFVMIEELETKAMNLSDEEFAELEQYESAETLGLFIDVLEQMSNPMLIAEKTVTVLDGKISVTDSVGNGSVSNNIVTVIAKGGFLSRTTNKVTIKNNYEKVATVSFEYELTGDYNSYSFPNGGATSGTYSSVLDPGASVVFTFESEAFYRTATLKLSNFGFVIAKEKSTVVINYDNNLGAVTVAESEIASGTSLEVSIQDGLALTASPQSGSTFVGWINSADNSYLESTANYTLKPAEDMEIKAIFAEEGGNSWFGVCGINDSSYRYLYDNLDDAVDSGNGDKIVVANSGRLPSGDYTIPAGKTLLVPFDNENALYTDSPLHDNNAEYVTPTAFRTLTMADGAHITVNGSISLSAKHHAGSAGQNSGSPIGPVSMINMNAGSSITVSNGGSLYAWGFIIGDGYITAESGANVHEYFQFNDFRGGTHTSQDSADLERVFPLNQYYIQNIEVPLTLEAGAKESCYTSIHMGTLGSQSTGLTFIADHDAMFNIESGYVTKSYDGSTDRLVISLDGEMTMEPLSMNVSGISIESTEFVLPITNNITVTINNGSGALIKQDLAMLPGAIINIEEGAECSLEQDKRVYVYDAEDWDKTYVYPQTGVTRPLAYAPGRTFNRSTTTIESAKVIVDGEFDASKGYLYSTEHGADISSTGTGKIIIGQIGTETETYQVTALARKDGIFSPTEPAEVEAIPITPVKLKNNSDSYKFTETANGTGTYKYINGIWHLGTDHTWDEGIVNPEPTCTEAGVKTQTCTVTSCGITKTVDEPATGHSYDASVTDPTCTMGGFTTYVCSVCGDTYRDNETAENDHSYNEAITSPTCTVGGFTTYTCTVCGDTYIDNEVIANGHDWDEGIITVSPSCLSAGVILYTCGECGATSSAVKAELGHHIVDHNSKLPTCTEIGWDAYESCSRCDYSTYVEIPATGHIGVSDHITEATCTCNGSIVTKCDTCGDVINTEEIEAQGHNVLTTSAIAPSCTTAGATTGSSCTICNEVFVAVEEIPALDHDYINHEAHEATCEGIGWEAYQTCSRCDYSTYIEIEALDHDYINHEAQAATCEEIGWDAYQTCSRCDYTTYVEIPALNHDFVEHEAQEVTCEEIGWDAYQTCSRCDYTTYVEIPALNHDYVDHEAQGATCEEIGWNAYQTCSRCDYTTYVEIPALGHDWDGNECTRCDSTLCGEEGHIIVTQSALTPTCTESGREAYEYCLRCPYTTYTEIPALGHTLTSHAALEATCEDNGHNAYEECSVCDYTTYELVPALGHNVVTTSAIAPSCITSGATTGSSCKVCHEVFVEVEVIPPLNHDYINHEAQAATCEGIGWEAFQTCTRCDYTTYEEIPALNHDYVNHEAQAATCEDFGWEAYQTCTRCDYSTYEEIDALNHNLVYNVGQAPTCTIDGWFAYYSCSRCDYNDKVVRDATGHNWDLGIETTPASCLENGVKTYTCLSGCGEVRTDIIAALGHDYINHAAQDPTCEEIGWDAYEDCSRCDYTTYVETPATGHTEVTSAAIEPTCTVAGITAGITCSVCSKVLVATTVLDATGHTVVTDAAIEATCTRAGVTEGTHCSVCGEILVAQEPVNIIPHSIVTVAAVEETCLTVGWDDYEYCEHCDYSTYVEIPALGHWIVQYPAMNPTYIEPGNLPYESCRRCDYSTYEKIDALGYPTVDSLSDFIYNLQLLEELAEAYVEIYPEKDPYTLIIKYIRTGVDRYNSGSWGIMAGYEDAGFAQFVEEKEAEINVQIFEETGSAEEYVKVTGLKNIENFYLPNGEHVDFGHMFGTMDITYHNLGSEDHADVGGWAGDLVDLMTSADRAYCKTTDSSVHLDVPVDFETMVSQIRNQIFLHSTCNDDKFNMMDYIGDLDAYYIMQTLDGETPISEVITEYFTADLTNLSRTEFFLKNRLGNPGTRSQVRDVVYSEYMSNKTLTTLENTREFGNTDKTYIANLRRACCYAFADYICYIAGDYVEVTSNPYYTEFYSEISTLAPGITQEIKKATTADNKQIVYYLATGDLSNPTVTVNANYGYHDTSKWEMVEVLEQANAAQEVHGNPESPEYIRNFQIVASINSDGFNMSTGEPGGLLIMDGEEIHPANSSGFFGITHEGKAVIGTTADYNRTYRGQLRDAVGAFGTMLVKDGELAITATSNYYSDRASRTAVGITRTGKVVFMVLDGRQEPWSCGGSMVEIAQIMLEAGCVDAVNLDGGGSTTFVSKPEGEDTLKITNRPSDGYARSVSSTLFMVSTAPSSTAFDHAVVESDYDYATVSTEVQLTAKGVSETGNVAILPDGWYWASSDDNWATVSEDGVFEGQVNGSGEVYIMLDGQIIGSKIMNVVVPDQVYFTRANMDVVYGSTYTMPVAARYNGKEVAVNRNDVILSSEPSGIGTFNKDSLAVVAESSIRTAKVIGKLAIDDTITGSMTINLFKQGENTFDFDRATAGDRLLAWSRTVANSTTTDNITYTIEDRSQSEESMVTEYIFAMDMSQIPIPKKLEDLVYMLPGASADNASAWNFMLQLAERISVLTTVTCTLEFDERFIVDYSNLKVYNEYFKLAPEDLSFDDETNVLTLNLRWVDQTAAIPAETANPLCMVTGIKLTPKADAFVNDKVVAVHSGEIGYKMYLRANALYSFANKPENQAQYGILPFTSTYNDNGVEKPESGGYFQSIYKTMEDQYTLSTDELNGWIHEGTGYAYYENGMKYYGVKAVEGYYYDFGEDGINQGQTKYTGLFNDNGTRRCVRLGIVVTDEWYMVDEVMYHCNAEGIAHDTTSSGNVTCVQGGRLYYTCDTCDLTERVGSYVMPKGHDWDDNHVCKKCGFEGIDINTGMIRFGTVDNPMPAGKVPKYYFSPKGSYPYAFVSMDGRTELTWSGDATLNDDGTMRDLFMGWTNLKGIGHAYVHFEGKGNYYGTHTMEYIIVPRSVTNLRVDEVITTDSNTSDSAITSEPAITSPGATTDSGVIAPISKSNASAVLSWDKADGADYYRVYFYRNGSREYIGRTTELTYTVTGLDLSGNNTYYFQVAGTAMSTDGLGEVYNSPYWSNTVSVPEGRNPGGSSGGGGGGFVMTDEDTTAEDGAIPGDGTCEGGRDCFSFHMFDVNPIAWYHHSVDYVIAKGLMSGTGTGRFEPNAPTTRAMIWTILARMEGEDTTPAAGEPWYAPGMKWAMENGISDGTNPNAKVTREQLATMLWRYAGELDSDHSIEHFYDDHHVSTWAEEGLQWANEEGIVTGMDGNMLQPQGNATRAQIATMIMRFLND